MSVRRTLQIICLTALSIMIASCVNSYVSPIKNVQDLEQKGKASSVKRYLKNRDPYARKQAIESIIRMEGCSEQIYAMADDKSSRVREALAINLKSCNTKEAVDVYIKLASDHSSIVRKAVAPSAIGNDNCASQCYLGLRNLLSDTDPFVKLSAASVLHNRFQDEAHEAVIEGLFSDLSAIKLVAIKILPDFKRHSDIYYLGDQLQSADNSIKVASRKSIEKILGRPLSGDEYSKIISKKPLDGSTAITASPLTRSISPAPSIKDAPTPTLADFSVKPTGKVNKNAVAVIIGNRNYSSVDIPNVDYALRDAQIIREVANKVLGVPLENIIYTENAGMSDFTKIFGSKDDHRGMLNNWVTPDSDVFIYYSGHGAPDIENKDAYFVPVDSDLSYIRLSGYPLNRLYENVSNLNVRSVTIVLDTCFSGITQAGSIIKSASPVFVQVKNPLVNSPNVVVFTSSQNDEISTWDDENKFGLFTYHFVKSLNEGDTNRDSTLTVSEVEKYVTGKVQYYARRTMNRNQNPQVVGQRDRVIFSTR